MRVTNRLLLGLACSALCIAFAGCSGDDHTYSPTDNTQNFYLSNVPNTQSSTVIVSNGAIRSSSSNQIYLTSNEPTGDPINTKLNIKSERPNTYGASSKTFGVTERVAVKAKTADAKLEFVPNTKYTNMDKGDTTDINVYNNGKYVSVPVTKLTSNDETSGVLVFSQVDPETMETVINHDVAMEIDQAFAVKNPYNSEGTPIADSAHEIVGKEFSPGIDGEEKIIVVVLSGDMMEENQASYVNYNDEYPVSEEKYSNEGEIIYLNGSLNDTEKMLQGVAQGLAHLCSFNQKVCRDGEYDGTMEDEVLEEGRSRFVADYSGFSLSGTYTETTDDGDETTVMACNELLLHEIDAYLKTPYTASLVMIDSDDPSVSYGQGYMLHRYIADRFGNEAVRRAAVSSSTGRNNLAEYTGLSFDQLFSDFTVANAVSDLNNTESIYNYKSISLTGTYGIEEQITLDRAVPVKMELTKGHLGDNFPAKAWSSNYFLFSYPDTVKHLHIGVSVPNAENLVHLALIEQNHLLKGLFVPSEEEY